MQLIKVYVLILFLEKVKFFIKKHFHNEEFLKNKITLILSVIFIINMTYNNNTNSFIS